MLAKHLTICSDIPYPPQEFFDENGNAEGMDVEIGNEIASRLGLKAQYVNTVFDSIILAVTGGKCDIVISAMNVTADRQKQISMIPYFQAGQSFVTLKGNPNKISTPMDLCGKSAAAESGTTEADYLQGTGDYAGKGLTEARATAGKQPINVIVAAKDTDALQQLQAGKVVIYSARLHPWQLTTPFSILINSSWLLVVKFSSLHLKGSAYPAVQPPIAPMRPFQPSVQPLKLPCRV